MRISRSVVVLSLLLVAMVAVPAAADCAPYTSGGGYARYSVTAATALTTAPTVGVALPSSAHGAVIFVNGASIRYRTDGTAPTTSEGLGPVSSTNALVFDEKTWTQLHSFVFTPTSGTVELTVLYCH